MKPKIIIIDDELSLRETLSMLVEELGYETMTFGSFHEVTSSGISSSCGNDATELIFMVDQNLPDGKGLDFISQRIQSGNCRCGGKCMAIMSGGLTREEYDKAEALGCSILEKPIMFDDLKSWLASISI
jgi:DNA-binding NtrC family response regulator